MNVIEQNDAGSLLAVAAQDNGEFFVNIYTSAGEAIDKIWISDHMELDKESLPIDGFHEPIITVSFVNIEVVFVQVYHRFE